MQLLYQQAYIDGKWVEAPGTFAVQNPFDGSEVAQVADCDANLIEQAIQAAHRAFPVWSQYTAEERSNRLKTWHRLQLENLDALAQLLTTEQGKPLAEAKGEIKYGASFVEWFAEEARRVYGDVIPGHGRDKRITVIKQPIGVVGAITPWNFPNAMITRKIAPALAAGCTVIIKPSDLTPLSALALAALAEKAGFPPGVINVIPCQNPEPVGRAFTQDPRIRKISFTGSTAVGKKLLEMAAPQVKKVSLELGGNAPFIVFNDADLDAAVSGCIASKFRNAGQTCVCSNRIFVQDAVYGSFVEKLTQKITQLHTGNGMETGVEIGPMISQKAVDKTQGLVDNALAKGARLCTGGNVLDGLLYAPTLLCDARKDMNLFQEEIFGPVAAIYRFSTEAEVISLANDTQYGLASYFYGRDYARIWRVAEALEYGMVGINTGMISTAVAPFGGIKQSGFGREGSKYGIDDYLNIKYMCWGEVS